VPMPQALWMLVIGAGKSIYDLIAHPFRFATNTELLLITGMIIA